MYDFVMPTGHFNTSRGEHEYAFIAPTNAELRRKENTFYNKCAQYNARILGERRENMACGLYVLFTYYIS